MTAFVSAVSLAAAACPGSLGYNILAQLSRGSELLGYILVLEEELAPGTKGGDPNVLPMVIIFQ